MEGNIALAPFIRAKEVAKKHSSWSLTFKNDHYYATRRERAVGLGAQNRPICKPHFWLTMQRSFNIGCGLKVVHFQYRHLNGGGSFDKGVRRTSESKQNTYSSASNHLLHCSKMERKAIEVETLILLVIHPFHSLNRWPKKFQTIETDWPQRYLQKWGTCISFIPSHNTLLSGNPLESDSNNQGNY